MLTAGDNENVLQELNIEVRTNADCASIWGQDMIHDAHICLGYGETGACNVSVSWHLYELKIGISQTLVVACLKASLYILRDVHDKTTQTCHIWDCQLQYKTPRVASEKHRNAKYAVKFLFAFWRSNLRPSITHALELCRYAIFNWEKTFFLMETHQDLNLPYNAVWMDCSCLLPVFKVP